MHCGGQINGAKSKSHRLARNGELSVVFAIVPVCGGSSFPSVASGGVSFAVGVGTVVSGASTSFSRRFSVVSGVSVARRMRSRPAGLRMRFGTVRISVAVGTGLGFLFLFFGGAAVVAPPVDVFWHLKIANQVL